jgi:hypothetical protein
VTDAAEVTDAPLKEVVVVDIVPITYIDEGESYTQHFIEAVTVDEAVATNAVFIATVEASFVSRCADVMSDKAALNRILGDFLLANLGAGYSKIVAYVSQTCAEVETGRRARRAIEAVVTTSVGFTEAEDASEADAEAAATTIVAAATSPEVANQLVYTASGVISSVGTVSVLKVTVADIIAEDPDRDAKILGNVAAPTNAGEGKGKGKKKKGKKNGNPTKAGKQHQPAATANVAASREAGKKGGKHDHPDHSKLLASLNSESSPSIEVVGIVAGLVAAVVVTVGVMLSRTKGNAIAADEACENPFEIVVTGSGITEQTPLVVAGAL